MARTFMDITILPEPALRQQLHQSTQPLMGQIRYQDRKHELSHYLSNSAKPNALKMRIELAPPLSPGSFE
jgi:hypothetical protein